MRHCLAQLEGEQHAARLGAVGLDELDVLVPEAPIARLGLHFGTEARDPGRAPGAVERRRFPLIGIAGVGPRYQHQWTRHRLVGIPPLEAGAGMADSDHFAASGNQLDADIAVEIPMRRRGTLQMTSRLAVEGDGPIQFLRNILRGGFQLIEIADIALEGLPSSSLLVEGDADDDAADIAIGVFSAPATDARGMPMTTSSSAADAPGRQADTKDKAEGGGGRAIYHASLWGCTVMQT
jgi:hypothetical protein